jgi:hypothetical protein
MTVGSTTRRRQPRRSRSTAPSRTVDMLARLGFTSRGVVYVLIGLLALAIALGKSAPAADRTGALQEVAAQPFGKVLLWLLVIGFGAMALWRFAQAYYGVHGNRKHGGAEILAFIRGVVYVAFFVGTLRFVLDARLPQSGNQQSKDFTVTAMAHTGGRILVIAVGLVIAGIGLYMIRTGLTKAFLKDLRMTGASRRTREGVTALGMIGNIARGAVFTGVGAFMFDAALRFNPSAAKGIDATLRSFAHTPLGPWLLAVVAIGLALFGVYSLCEARWHRTV